MEMLRYQKQIDRYRFSEPPVFIIGFWRSGTTLLHNLMCQDPTAAYTTTFQTVFPHITLTQSWWLKHLINFFLPAKRPFDQVSMDVDFPQEEEFGMMNLQFSTIYKFFLFPSEWDRIIGEELDTASLPHHRLEPWKKACREIMVKAALNTGGTRFIGKNPCNLARIGLLQQMFPEAKFIFIHRHPYFVIESLYRFILSIFPGTQLQDVPASFTREKILHLYRNMMHSYLAERARLDPGNLAEIRMDEFVNDKTGHLESIYKHFGLGGFDQALKRMNLYLERFPQPNREAYQPDPAVISMVNRDAGDLMEVFGYSPS